MNEIEQTHWRKALSLLKGYQVIYVGGDVRLLNQAVLYELMRESAGAGELRKKCLEPRTLSEGFSFNVVLGEVGRLKDRQGGYSWDPTTMVIKGETLGESVLSLDVVQSPHSCNSEYLKYKLERK